MKRCMTLLLGAGVLVGGLTGGVAGAASSTASSGVVKVWVTPSPTGTTSKHPGKVMFTGSIGDYGKSTTVNSSGKPKKNGNYEELKLHKGTILVDTSSFNKSSKAAFSAPTTLNKQNCSIAITISAPVVFASGTGAYSGIKGTFTLTANFAAITKRTKNGKCTTKTTTPALSTYTSIIGSGSVTLP